MLSNQNIKEIFNKIYNNFWNKYKDSVILPDSPLWYRVENEVMALVREFAGHPLAVHMLGELMNILDERGKETINNGRKE